MLHGKRKKARAAALETIMVLSDKFSTQNRRTKKTTKPALAATKLPNRIAKQRPWILRGRRPRALITFWVRFFLISSGKSFRNSKGLQKA
jgi:hypothetical protein